MQSFDYDISPILQQIFSLNLVYYIWYRAFIKGYYFLCVKKTIEQSYRNMCLLIRKLFILAYLSVRNILFYN